MRRAFVKLLESYGLLGISAAERPHAIQHPADKECVRMRLGTVELVTGEAADEENPLILKARQAAIIRPSTELKPREYHLMVEANPALSEAGILAVPLTGIVSAGEVGTVGLLLIPQKKVDLGMFDHHFRLFMID